MCNTCKQYNIEPEYEAILHGEEEATEMEWGGFSDAIKKFTSPFFNWVSPPANTVDVNVENQILISTIAGGQRDETSLTNNIFYRRHPELNNRPLSRSQSNFDALSKEWLDIRNNQVRRYLKSINPYAKSNGSTTIAPPAPSSYSGSGKVTLQNILNAMNRKGYVVYQEPYRLNIVGVRANNATSDGFDDSINVFYKDDNGSWKFTSYTATTDPGKKYLNTPINPHGTAILKPGQYINSHKLGLHRGQYTALTQQGKVTVIRDTNKDSTLDFNSSKEESGYFGINVHHATDSGISKTVGGWSAGCQVFAGSSDFATFIALCKQHSSRHGNNFTYTLLTESDL